MEIEDDGSSSSSNISSIEITKITDSGNVLSQNYIPRASKKRRAGRKKFKETRHPVFRGVRKRNENKWICEVREPNKKSRIWLGTFPTPEMAARAHDAAALALRGEKANLNFTDSAWHLKRAKSSSVQDIQVAAVQAASMFRTSIVSFSSPSFSINFQANTSNFGGMMGPPEIEVPNVESEFFLGVPSLANSAHVTTQNDDLGTLNPARAMFMDEEVLFNMPSFYNSMAEGLVITPPAVARGYDWGSDDLGCDMDLTLWRH